MVAVYAHATALIRPKIVSDYVLNLVLGPLVASRDMHSPGYSRYTVAVFSILPQKGIPFCGRIE